MTNKVLLSMLAAGVTPVVAYAVAPAETLNFKGVVLTPGVPQTMTVTVVPGNYKVISTEDVALTLSAPGVAASADGSSIKVETTTTITVTAKSSKSGVKVDDVIVYLDEDFATLRTKYLDEASRYLQRAKAALDVLGDVKDSDNSIQKVYDEIYDMTIKLGNLNDGNPKAYEIWKEYNLYNPADKTLENDIAAYESKVTGAMDEAKQLVAKKDVLNDVATLNAELTKAMKRWTNVKNTLGLGNNATNAEVEKEKAAIVALISQYEALTAVDATKKGAIVAAITAFDTALQTYEGTLSALQAAQIESGRVFVIIEEKLNNKNYTMWFTAVRGKYAEYAKVIQDAINQNITTSASDLTTAAANITGIETLYFGADGRYTLNEKNHTEGLAAITAARAALKAVPAGATDTGHNVNYTNPNKNDGSKLTSGNWVAVRADIVKLIDKEESKINKAYDESRDKTAYGATLVASNYSLTNATNATSSLNELVDANNTAKAGIEAAITGLNWTGESGVKAAANKAAYYTDANGAAVTANGKYTAEESNVESLINTVTTNAQTYWNEGKATDYKNNSINGHKYNENKDSEFTKADTAAKDYVAKTAQAVNDYKTLAAYISGQETRYAALNAAVDNGSVICFDGKGTSDWSYGKTYRSILADWDSHIKNMKQQLDANFAKTGYTGHVNGLHTLLTSQKDVGYYTFNYSADKTKYYQDLATTATDIRTKVSNAISDASTVLAAIKVALTNNCRNLNQTTAKLKYGETTFDALYAKYNTEFSAQNTAFGSVKTGTINPDEAQGEIAKLSPITEGMNELLPLIQTLKTDLDKAVARADANAAKANALKTASVAQNVVALNSMNWSSINTVDTEKQPAYATTKAGFQTTKNAIIADIDAAFKAQTLCNDAAYYPASNVHADLVTRIKNLDTAIKNLANGVTNDNANWYNYQAIITGQYFNGGASDIKTNIASQRQQIAATAQGAAYECYAAILTGYANELDALYKAGTPATGSIRQNYLDKKYVSNVGGSQYAADNNKLATLLRNVNAVIGQAQANEAAYSAMKTQAEAVKDAIQKAEDDIVKVAANPTEKASYGNQINALRSRLQDEYNWGTTGEVKGGNIFDKWNIGQAAAYRNTADGLLKGIADDLNTLVGNWNTNFNKYAWTDVENAKDAAVKQYALSTQEVSEYTKVGGQWNEDVTGTNQEIYKNVAKIEAAFNKATENKDNANKKGIVYNNADDLTALNKIKQDIIDIQAGFSLKVNTDAINAYQTLKNQVEAAYSAAEGEIKNYDKYKTYNVGNAQYHPWKEVVAADLAAKNAVKIKVADVTGGKTATKNDKTELNYRFALDYYSGNSELVGSEAYLNALKASIANTLNNAAYNEWSDKYTAAENILNARQDIAEFSFEGGMPSDFGNKKDVVDAYNAYVGKIVTNNDSYKNTANGYKDANDGRMAANVGTLKTNLADDMASATNIYNAALNVSAKATANVNACNVFGQNIDGLKTNYGKLKDFVDALYIDDFKMGDVTLKTLAENIEEIDGILADYKAKGGAANDTKSLRAKINAANDKILRKVGGNGSNKNDIANCGYLQALKDEVVQLKELASDLMRTYNNAVGEDYYQKEYVEKIAAFYTSGDNKTTLEKLAATVNASGQESTLETKQKACLAAEKELGELKTEIANLKDKTVAKGMVDAIAAAKTDAVGKIDAVLAGIAADGATYPLYPEDEAVKAEAAKLEAAKAEVEAITVEEATVAMWESKYLEEINKVVVALENTNKPALASKLKVHKANKAAYDKLLGQLESWKTSVVDEYEKNLLSFTSIIDKEPLVVNGQMQYEQDGYTPIMVHTPRYVFLDKATAVYNSQKTALGNDYNKVVLDANSALNLKDLNDPTVVYNEATVLAQTKAAAAEHAGNLIDDLDASSLNNLPKRYNLTQAIKNEIQSNDFADLIEAVDTYNRYASNNAKVQYDVDGTPLGKWNNTNYDYEWVPVTYWKDGYNKVLAQIDEINNKIDDLYNRAMANTFTKGDITGDRSVNSLDYGRMLYWILGDLDNDIKAEILAEDRLFEAGDFDNSGDYEVGDLTNVANIIRGTYGNASAKARAAAPGIAKVSDSLSLEATPAGETTTFAISLEGINTYAAAQLDIVLPRGAEIVSETLGISSVDMDLHANTLENGTRRVVLSSLEGATISGAGAMLLVEVRNAQNIGVANAKVADVNGRTIALNSVGEVSEATAIDTIANAFKSAGEKIYTVGGQVMNSLKKGINIIIGEDGTAKKVLKK